MSNYFDLMQFYTLQHAMATLDEKTLKKIYRDPVDYQIDKDRIEKFTGEEGENE
jgi:hypothetical protein